ncbi:MAG: hypothetical protein JNK29_11715, partial [Anaerolineales bacterium]|nr:hypothetical protein [Anaerolineales bacterium]
MPVLQHWSVLVYALIVALAAILFFAQLTQFPRTLWVDEAWFGLKGRAVLSGQNLFPFEVPGSGVGVGNSPFQIYASAAAQSLGVPAAYSSRAASAAAGLLTVVLLYPALLVLFRDLLPPAQRAPAALLGTAALATQFVSLFYSRDGSQHASCLLATLVVAAGTYLAFERRSRGWAIAAG